jgi:hypothetical protein
MSALKETVAKRIADLWNRLGSDFEPEALNSLRAIKRLLKSEGLSFPDIAIVIENANGEIEARKYSDADAQVIFDKGVEQGRAEAGQRQDKPSDFYDTDGEPRWPEIAMFCQRKDQDPVLRDKEREFIADMVSWTTSRGAPTQKQATWLLGIFRKLRGHLQ